MKKLLVLLLLVFPLLMGTALSSAQTTSFDITLSFDNLADPGEDHYEGWVIEDGNAVTTGKFTLDNNGNIVDLDGESIDTFQVEADLEKVTKFVLTLESSGDTDTTPAAIKPVAGDFNSEKTSASLSHNIGVDFSDIAGSYILATPTNGADTNENSGIWFLDPTGEAPVAGLDLPDLSDTDWIYEGWVVIGGIPVTSGTFNNPDGADDDDPYSGSKAAPPFPGEDYLENAPGDLTFPTDIAGGIAVISVEPRMDNSDAPFQFKPLVGAIPDDATDHTLYQMDDKSSSLPTGLVEVTDTSAGFLPLPSVFVFLSLTVLVAIVVRRLRVI